MQKRLNLRLVTLIDLASRLATLVTLTNALLVPIYSI
jgi:hypothetical protein